MTQAALPILRTPRLELRPLHDDDAVALARGVGNFDVSKWLAVVPYPYDISDARAFLARVAAQDKPFWAICNAHGLKGVISLGDELAYWLARDAWGKGYGFEAAHAVAAHWFADPRNDTLVSGYFDGNERSGDLLRALGFQLKERVTRYAKSFQQDVVSNQMVLTRALWEAREDLALFTPRLSIRAFEHHDVPALVDMAVPEVARNLAMIQTGWSAQQATNWMQHSRFCGVPGFRLAIERDGVCVGSVGIGGTPVSLAYFLAPSHWGQGLMTEALAAFLPALFGRFPVRTIVADHFEDNPASGTILRKFGFQETGREMQSSKARLEPAPVITYALRRESLRVPV